MKACAHHPQVVAWAAQGSELAIPEFLSAHAVRCEACALLIASVRLGRQLGQLLPNAALTPSRHDAVKFLLMAEARRGGTDRRKGRHAYLGIRLLVAAIITSGVATAWYAAHRVGVGFQPAESEVAVAQSLPRLETHHLGRGIERALGDAASRRQLQFAPKHDPANPGSSTQKRTDESASAVQASPGVDGDAAFSEAWVALRAKRPAEAARRFDALLDSGALDPARRADVLYWSAQSHRQAGAVGVAISRSNQLLRQHPSSHHACDAALILGEYALANQQFDQAAQFLNLAARSERSVVRERAQRALRELMKKQ